MAGDREAKDQWMQIALGVAAELLAARDALGLGSDPSAAPSGGSAQQGRSKARAKPAPPKGSPGKFGNRLHQSGNYVASLPADATGTLPLVVIFAGNTGKSVVIEGTPADYFTKAIVVFGERDGKFSDVSALLKPLLEQSGAKTGSVTICGYSSGGQAAFANYEHADKAVGLIDPNVQKKDFATFDSKTIYSFYDPNPDAWNFPADPADPSYTVGQARIDAFELVKKAGGYAEKTKQGHAGYPKYFLSTFESKLI
ncbi:MAG TPA: hypothetical protein VFE51_16995 [Verrucomicrobiae bacterium]|nr:hypothetical protein [Verrucomicrobiae bacterium]